MKLQRNSNSIKTLEREIENYNIPLKLKELEKSGTLAFKLKNIKQHSATFIKLCMSYAIFEQFAWTFDEPLFYITVALSLSIK